MKLIIIHLCIDLARPPGWVASLQSTVTVSGLPHSPEKDGELEQRFLRLGSGVGETIKLSCFHSSGPVERFLELRPGLGTVRYVHGLTLFFSR
jgi:hypothetical protein